MSQTPTFSEALRAAIKAATDTLQVAIPGRVESYDASKIAVDVQPLIRRGYVDEEGARQVEDLPVVPDVPLVFPGAGANRITFPVSAGDTVLLIVCGFSIDKWLSDGGLVDPIDDRRHALIDAVAIPGLRAFKNPTAAGTAALAIEGADVRLGSHSANDPVALKSDLQELYDIINAWIPSAGDGGAALKTAVTAGGGVGWDFPGATKVKAE